MTTPASRVTAEKSEAARQAPGDWRYDIQYGPDGEANYAWLYDETGEMVGTMQTYQAARIVAAIAKAEGRS